MSIQENLEFRMTNVLSFRKKLTQAELQQETEHIGRFIEEGGYIKTGPTVSVTFSIEQQDGVQLLDIEILIPLDKPFVPPEGCVCKAEIHVTNAVSIRHIGNPSTLQDTCNLLMAYIQEHELQPITCAYNVTTKDANTIYDVEDMIVDVYIGISPNIL
ncbi:MAG: AraC family transcriptional regulator [Oscillospiraceae bacterium]|nr:AraC family transcriptional regulator [Oscillospiraceae bacterium]